VSDDITLQLDRPPRRGRRTAIWTTLVGLLVVVAAGLVVVDRSGDPERNPADILSELRSFVAKADGAHFTGSVTELSGSGDDREQIQSDVEGDFAPVAGALRWSVAQDGWVREGIVYGSHFYRRSGSKDDVSPLTPWAYYSAGMARGRRVVDFSEPTFLRDVEAVAPFVSWLTPGELGGLLTLLREPERVDDDTIQGSLELHDILGDFTGGAGLRDLEGGVNMTLTSRDGRLEGMRWIVHMAARPGSPLADDARAPGRFQD
jgi:hypothetical protein